MKEQLIHWLIQQQDKLDSVISNASRAYYAANKNSSNFQYDLQRCHNESYNLVRGTDLCYDRPNTAFAYSLWYHPRRINTFLSYFLDKLTERQNAHLDIFDLGAGTGAIQWCVALLHLGLKHLGLQPPSIRVVNIDSSPFMLTYHRDYLWKEFLKEYPKIDSSFSAEYEVNSWTNGTAIKSSNAILAASYLFDASDNRQEIAKDFAELAKKFDVDTILLLTSNQPLKLAHLASIEEDLRSFGFNSRKIADSNLLFKRPLVNIDRVRSELGKIHEVPELLRNASWIDGSYSGTVLQKAQSQISFGSTSNPIPHIDIYNPPIVIRQDVQLNEKQTKAAHVGETPSVIAGPAGCGKSIVITEKIKNIVEHNQYSPELKILVTSFNKGLIGKLAEWLREILDPKQFTFGFDTSPNGYEERSSHFTFKNSKEINIRILHFDMLPKRIGGVRYRSFVDKEQHCRILREIVLNLKKEDNITSDQYDNILNEDFLFEEYHRVIYGLQVGIAGAKEKYLTVARRGRGNNPSMPRNSIRRNLAWRCLSAYALAMHRDNIDSFTLRRQYLYGKLKSGEIKPLYDYILIDEFQDCTEADFEIFFSLVKHPNNLTIAGDLAQSVHLGTAAKLPRDERMSKRQFHRLEGSYRLPVRISEAIQDLSRAIVKRFGNDEGVNDIVPYKGSPPGARPIVVYGANDNDLASRIVAIFNAYTLFGITEITILEKDVNLKTELSRCGLSCETDSILSLKGLEKHCVLWSTRAPLEYENEALEFAYTIVTRTSRILIIVISDQTQIAYKKALGLLNKDRLIFWDRTSQEKFELLSDRSEVETVRDEED